MNLVCRFICHAALISTTLAEQPAVVKFAVERTVMSSGYDGTRCWVHARAGILPSTSSPDSPTVVLTTQPLIITGSDVFLALNSAFTTDLGKTWSQLVEQPPFSAKAGWEWN